MKYYTPRVDARFATSGVIVDAVIARAEVTFDPPLYDLARRDVGFDPRSTLVTIRGYLFGGRVTIDPSEVARKAWERSG